MLLRENERATTEQSHFFLNKPQKWYYTRSDEWKNEMKIWQIHKQRILPGVSKLKILLIFRTVDCAICSVRNKMQQRFMAFSQFEMDIEINEVQNWNLIGFSLSLEAHTVTHTSMS